MSKYDNSEYRVPARKDEETIKDLLKALEKAEKRIEQLCETVNVLAGFRKVRADDFAEEVRAAIKAATGEEL